METLRGSCQCGGVRFELPDDFLSMSFCHCATCKKISGGVGTASGGVRTESIRLLAGDDLVRTYQPDEGSAKTFCSVCGSNLFGSGWPDSELTSVRLSAIDTPFDTGRPGTSTSARSRPGRRSRTMVWSASRRAGASPKQPEPAGCAGRTPAPGAPPRRSDARKANGGHAARRSSPLPAPGGALHAPER
jgi:hypothetical protein